MKNDGAADLSIGAIAGASAPFQHNKRHMLEPDHIAGGKLFRNCSVSPTGGGTFSANLGIPSNDPDETTVNAQLSGASRMSWVLTSVSGNGNLGSWADAGGKTGLASR